MTIVIGDIGGIIVSYVFLNANPDLTEIRKISESLS